MYGPEAIALRRCRGTRQDGSPCQAWALWTDPRGLCVAHARPGPRGPYAPFLRRGRLEPPANYVPCRCPAYQWPHRPGGGYCRWPLEPICRVLIPTGTRRYRRERSKTWRAVREWFRVRAPRHR